MEKKLTLMNECYSCKHKKVVHKTVLIACANPDKKMTGNLHGIRKGWFCYPGRFDPVWKTKKCSNFEMK